MCSAQKTSANHSAPHIDYHNSEHAIHDRGFGSSTGRTNREGSGRRVRAGQQLWWWAACHALRWRWLVVPPTCAGSPNCPGSIRDMVRQNATADLVGANVAKVPGGDDYDAAKEQQFGNAANVIGTNDSSKLNVFTSRTLGMAEGRGIWKASDKYTSMIHDLAKANGLSRRHAHAAANAYDADNESHSIFATVKTTIGHIRRATAPERYPAERTDRQHHLHRSGYHTRSVPVQGRQGNIPGRHLRAVQGR